MKGKMLAVLVAGLLAGCGGDWTEFQSQNGEPEVRPALPEYQVPVNTGTEEPFQPQQPQKESKQEEKHHTESTFNEIEDALVCHRRGLENKDDCMAAMEAIETGFTQAHEENVNALYEFQTLARGLVATAEGGIQRVMNRPATYPEVIEYITMSCTQSTSLYVRFNCAGQAIAYYYYVKGVPEEHNNLGNPGLCPDRGFCAEQYLKYEWIH